MNIFLDSNAWLEDKHLKSTAFSSLCDYLKRTGSSIVLPNLVLEEVLGVYDRTLLEKCEKAFNAGVDVLKYLITQKSEDQRFRLRIDRNGEVAAFRERLLEPAVGIKTIQCDESAVDIREVYRRGIRRKRPANKDGEELRDVILWLTVLEYAHATKSRVALVTRDKAFWDGENNLHAELRGDVASLGVDVAVYKDVETFNKDNALKSSPITASIASTLFDVRSLDSAAIAKIGQQLDGMEAEDTVLHFRSGKVLDASIDNGTLYDVATDIQFAEIPYKCTVSADVVFKPRLKTLSPWLSGTTIPTVSLARLAALAGDRKAVVNAKYSAQVSMRIVKGLVESADIDDLWPISFMEVE